MFTTVYSFLTSLRLVHCLLSIMDRIMLWIYTPTKKNDLRFSNCEHFYIIAHIKHSFGFDILFRNYLRYKCTRACLSRTQQIINI